jgi:hypothetical protein
VIFDIVEEWSLYNVYSNARQLQLGKWMTASRARVDQDGILPGTAVLKGEARGGFA